VKRAKTIETRVLKRRKTKDKKPDKPLVLLPKRRYTPIHLRNAYDCRLYLSRIINKVEHFELDPKIANCIANLVNVLLRSLNEGEIADRLKVLERFMDECKAEKTGDIF